MSDPQAVKSILQGLDSRDEGVRNSVARKLRELRAVEDEDELVVAELAKRLGDEHPPVRRSALQVLKEVVPLSSEAAIPVLLLRAGASSSYGRRGILQALEHFGKGDARVVKVMVKRLEDAEASVRAQALVSLAACAGAEDVALHVLRRLEDVAPEVRLAAAKAVPAVACDHLQVMAQLAQLCRNQRPPPQRENLMEAACHALALLGPGVEATKLVGECIQAEYPQATRAALKALAMMCPGGDHHGLEAAAEGLRHPEAQLRQLTAEVLERLARAPRGPPGVFEGDWSGAVIKGNKIFWKCDDLITDLEVKGRSIISTCIERAGREMTYWARLTHPDCLRWDFGEEWLKSEEEALPALSLDAMAPSVPAPRRASVVEDLQDVEDLYPVAVVAALFKAEESSVRKAAVLALPRVTGPCSAAVEALLPLMQDESVDVRHACVQSLVKVAPAEHAVAVQAMKVRLEDQEVSQDSRQGYSVGVCAARALKKMVCREDLVEIAKHLNFTGPSIRGF